MKIAISNLAWNADEEGVVAAEMLARDIYGVEVAPTKIWRVPSTTTATARLAYRRAWEARGVRIVALQALLFGQPNLAVFGDPTTRARTLDYLTQMISLAADLGARVLVFGSPRQRAIGDLPRARAIAIAVHFFAQLGEVAQRHNTVFCIEPNPAAYGCDFVRTAAEGVELVRAVDHPGFRLHLDTSALTLNGEHPGRAVAQSFAWLAHLHVSEPHLDALGSGSTDHAGVAHALREYGYTNWVSIEMRGDPERPNAPAVRAALDMTRKIYGTNHRA